MRLLREGCADDASGRLLRNARALPRLLAHLDCVGTGGWDEDLGRLAFHAAPETTGGMDRSGKTSNLSISVTSKSFRPIFGRTVFSR